jgi:hypothetical protein
MKTSLSWILFIAALIGCVVLWNMLNGSEMSRQSAKSVFLEQEKQLQRELAIERAKVDAERATRQSNDSIHRLEIGGLTSDLKASKRKERRLRVDTVTMTLTDTIFAQYDTIILKTVEQKRADSLSFEREIKILTGSNLKLDSANTAKLTYMVKQSDIIESQDKKISKLQRLSKILGISTGALAVILALIVAL